VARARSAAMFCASPTETMISASSDGGFHAHQFDRGLRGGVDLGRAADDSHRHRHFERADEVSVRVFAPGGERGVLSVFHGVGVRARFNGAPVVAGGNDHRVHAVHDAFVVGGGAVRVHGGEGVGGDDPVADSFA
jgi:hypothetical protein